MALILNPWPFDHRMLGSWIGGVKQIIAGDVVLGGAGAADVWSGGGIVDWTPSGVVTLESTSGNDLPAGTGIGSVLLTGSDAGSGQVAVVVYPLNGTTPVITTEQFKGPLLELSGVTAGSGGDEYATSLAAGDITAKIGGVVAGAIRQGENAATFAALRSPFMPGGGIATSVLLDLVVSVAPATAGKGLVKVQLYSKSGSAPPLPVGPTLAFETESASSAAVSLPTTLASEGILFARAVTTKAVQVFVSISAVAYGPLTP